VSFGAADTDAKDDATVVKHALEGPLPGIDRMLSKSGLGSGLAGMIATRASRRRPARSS
jgi:hypothetical protein